jgi:hypothetical protein
LIESSGRQQRSFGRANHGWQLQRQVTRSIQAKDALKMVTDSSPANRSSGDFVLRECFANATTVRHRVVIVVTIMRIVLNDTSEESSPGFRQTISTSRLKLSEPATVAEISPSPPDGIIIVRNHSSFTYICN